MTKSLQFILFSAVIFALACEPEEEQISGDSGLKLTFSADTVLFDTLLSSLPRSSITKRFRIINPNRKAVRVADIRLGKGNQSNYSIIVNGKEGNSVRDEVIFGGDSLLVLVNVNVGPQNQDLPYLVKDSVIVEWNGMEDHVKLVAWGQDANFINAAAICDEVWTAERPYVIYNLALVDTLCTLTMEPGTRVYIDNDASLFVQGTLKILGDSGNHVTIRNTRFDEDYLKAPGQWGGIFFLEGSKDNEIRYADIENGQIGLGLGYSTREFQSGFTSDIKTDLNIGYSTIRNMSQAGVLSFTSDLYMYNSQIYNAGSFLVGNLAGGNYKYEHCTFSNAPSSFINDDPMLQFSDNVIIDDNELLTGDLSLEMTNCIVWGEGKNQLLFSNEGGASFDTTLTNNIIKSTVSYPGNFISQENNYPGFIDPLNQNYELDSLAFARDKGLQIGITDDLNGIPRDVKPDIGAFERVDNE
ncbi:MAG: right-handed parallel beta-helix repeat-containing protein [Marinoscillum sp.]